VRVLPLQPAVPARAAGVAAPPAAPAGAALAARAAAPPAQPQPPAQPAALALAAASTADPALWTAAATGRQRQRLHGEPVQRPLVRPRSCTNSLPASPCCALPALSYKLGFSCQCGVVRWHQAQQTIVFTAVFNTVSSDTDAGYLKDIIAGIDRSLQAFLSPVGVVITTIQVRVTSSVIAGLTTLSRN